MKTNFLHATRIVCEEFLHKKPTEQCSHTKSRGSSMMGMTVSSPGDHGNESYHRQYSAGIAQQKSGMGDICEVEPFPHRIETLLLDSSRPYL